MNAPTYLTAGLFTDARWVTSISTPRHAHLAGRECPRRPQRVSAGHFRRRPKTSGTGFQHDRKAGSAAHLAAARTPLRLLPQCGAGPGLRRHARSTGAGWRTRRNLTLNRAWPPNSADTGPAHVDPGRAHRDPSGVCGSSEWACPMIIRPVAVGQGLHVRQPSRLCAACDPVRNGPRWPAPTRVHPGRRTGCAVHPASRRIVPETAPTPGSGGPCRHGAF